LRAVIQRVSSAGVYIPDANYSEEISFGMVILLGIKAGDGSADADYLADKCCNLRFFNDENQKMNLSVRDVQGEVLVISQFTLYGDTDRGNRPGYTDSAKPEVAVPLYEAFLKRVEHNIGPQRLKKGKFGAMMQVRIINEGPVTLIVDSK
jgi:D-aminoacyl-tRNA deacylase